MVLPISLFFWNMLMRLTLAGSGLALVILILSPITQRFFPSRWNVLFCAGTLLFFIVPFYLFVPEGALSIYMSPMELLSLLEASIDPSSPGLDVSISAQLEAVLFGLDRVIFGIALLWGAVTAFLGIRHLVKWFRFSKALERTSREETSQEVLALYEETALALGLRRKPRLFRCSTIGTPFLMGLLRPRLCLPEQELSAEQLRLVLLHELTHYRRGDLWLKAVAFIISTAHWMNPFSFFIRRRLGELCELACDEALSAGMSREERHAYGMVVLELMGSSLPASCTAFSKPGNRFKKRLSALMEPKRISPLLRFCCCTLSILFLMAGLTVSSVLGSAFSPDESASIGIIGGADGPTAIFIAESPTPQP